MADLAPALSPDFSTARRHYEQMLAISNAIPVDCGAKVGSDCVPDLGVELWLAAFEHMISIPAPDHEAFAFKVNAVRERCGSRDRCDPGDIYLPYWLALLCDISCLGGSSAAELAGMLSEGQS